MTCRVAYLILLLTTCLNSPAAYGQDTATVLPSAWAWQISNQNRTIYLVGEIHAFIVPKDTTVDYQLGFDIYDAVSEVWREASFINPSTRYATKPLSTRLKSKTRQDVTNAITGVIDTAGLPAPAIVELKNKILFDTEKQSAAMAFTNLYQISYFKYLASQPKTKSLPGLTIKLISKEKNTNQKKLSEIEASTLSDDIYHEQCDTDSIAEEYVEAGLKYFDLEFFWNNGKLQTLQKVFANPTATQEELLSAWLQFSPENSLLLKCNAKPRNLAWLPKIVDALQTNGPPIAVLVGAIHMVGEGGLLALLKEKGFSDSRRIYSVPKP